ncbi:MAG: alpha/beta hydrolase [bacterium]
MSAYFTTTDGIRLAYDLHGSGTPLLCLAGLTRNMADFDYALPHLTGVTVIRMDYRGRGASDRAPSATYTVLQEAQDALALLDHLNIPATAVLGTSRGGLIGMLLAYMAKPRLLGLCLTDIGPEIDRAGLERIGTYVGHKPAAVDQATHAGRLAAASPAFTNVPESRWLDEARHQTRTTANGLQLAYDPALRDAFLASMAAPAVDLWPLYDACWGLPLALIRGANTDLLTPATVAEMTRRRPDLIYANVAGRGHVPFLDEPQALTAMQAFVKALR